MPFSGSQKARPLMANVMFKIKMKKYLIYFFAMFSLFFTATSAFACSCKSRDKVYLFEQADAVFLAEVTNTKLKKIKIDKDDDIYEIVEAEFLVIEEFKTKNRKISIVRDVSFGFGNCSIGLMSGMEYIFFVKKGSSPLTNYVGMCTGSYAINLGANTTNKMLEKYRLLGKKKQQ